MRIRSLTAVAMTAMVIVLVPLEGSSLIRMNLHGVGVLSKNRVLIVTHTTEPNVRLAITPDPQAGPETEPSVIVLKCAQVKPYSPELGGGDVRVTKGRTLYASGPVRGKPGRFGVIAVRDSGAAVGGGGLLIRDFAAVKFMTGAPGGSLCGAGALTLKPLQSGNFVSRPLW